LNTAQFGRARVIREPRHWRYDPRDKLTDLEMNKGGIGSKETGKRKIFERIYAYFGYQWAREILLNRG